MQSAGAVSTWATKLGGAGVDDTFRGVERLADGYIVVGHTSSFGAGSNDAWVVKLDDNANIESQRTFGGKGGDVARAVRATPDGGFIVAGFTRSFTSGGTDMWVLKFGSNENLQWAKSYGGIANELAHAIDVTSDGGYLVGGSTTSFGAVGQDYFVIKLDSQGNQQWAKRFGGNGNEVIRVVKETSNQKYLVAGFTHSFGVAGDIMVIQLDSNGDIEWEKRYGGNKFEEPCCILEMSDGYIILEQSTSFSAGSEAWVFKINKSGNMLWQKRYGGAGFDELSSARFTPDGGFLTVGETKAFGAVVEDYWAVKFSANGVIQWAKRYGGSGVDEAEGIALAPEGGFVAVGTTRSFGSLGEDIWVLKANANGNVAQCNPGVTANMVTAAHTINTNAVPANTAVIEASVVASVRNSNPIVTTSNANVSLQCDVVS